MTAVERFRVRATFGRLTAGLRQRTHRVPATADADPGSDGSAAAEVRRLVREWAAGEPRAEEIISEATRVRAYEVLVAAIRPGEAEVAFEADLLAAAAWLFWARWKTLPDGPDREALESALRIFLLLNLVDRDALGAPGNLPPEVHEALGQVPDAAVLLADEALAVAESLLRRFHPASLTAVEVLTSAALVLTPEDAPDRADRYSLLASVASTAFRVTGDRASLDRAVAACQDAVSASLDDVARAPHLVNLGISLREHGEAYGDAAALRKSAAVFERLLGDGVEHLDTGLRARAMAAYGGTLLAEARASGNRDLIGLAIDRLRAAVAASARLNHVTDLAEMLRERYAAGEARADLDEAAALMREVLSQTAHDDPDLPRRQGGLAGVLAADEAAGLTPAIELYEAALARTNRHDRLRPQLLTNLGQALLARHRIGGGHRDLSRSIAAQRLALCPLPAGDFLRPTVHGNYGNALAAWTDRTNRLGLLNQGVEQLRIGLRAPERSRRATLLANLAGLLLARAMRSDRDDDLAEAVAAGREAVDLTPPRDQDLSRRLANLGLALEQSFERWGHEADLTEAVGTQRRACAAASGPRRQAHHLGALASTLMLRYWTHGVSADRVEAIALYRRTVGLLSADESDHPRLVANLATALMSRNGVSPAAAEVQEAVQLLRAAVRETPDGGVDLPYRLDTLGVALTRQAELDRDPGTAADAVQVAASAVQLTEDQDQVREARLRHLGDAYEQRFDLSGAPADLNAAVDAYRAAVDACPDGLPDRALDEHDLARTLLARGDLPEARAVWRAAAGRDVATVPVRLAAAEGEASAAVAAGDFAAAETAFRLALVLVTRLGSFGLPRRDRERQLSEWPGLAGDAAAIVLGAGRKADALELADSGRSLLWQRTLQLRADLDRLTLVAPDLAHRLGEVGAALQAQELGRERPERATG